MASWTRRQRAYAPTVSTRLSATAAIANPVRTADDENPPSEWRATPPASSASAVRIQARNVRSLASVKR